MSPFPANNVFHALQGVARSVERFTAEPLCADLFAWCAMTGTDTRLRSRLELLKVPFGPATAVSHLKAKLEFRITNEKERLRVGLSNDINRLIALKQALATVEKYQAAAAAARADRTESDRT